MIIKMRSGFSKTGLLFAAAALVSLAVVAYWLFFGNGLGRGEISGNFSIEEACKNTGGTPVSCPKNPGPNAGACIPCQCPEGKTWRQVLGSFACVSGTAVKQTELPCTEKECMLEADTSTWKTYRNEEYGFEARYPSNLFISEDESTVVFSRSVSNEEQPTLSISVDKNPQRLTLKEYFDGNPGMVLFDDKGAAVGSVKDIVIGGRSAVIVNPIVTFSVGEIIVVPFESFFLIIHDNGGTFRYDGLLEQMLYTFKFTK